MTRTALVRAHAVAARYEALRGGFSRDVIVEPSGASASIALLVFLACFGLAVSLGSLLVR